MRALLRSTAGNGLGSPSLPQQSQSPQQSVAISVDSNMVVILASLLCALVSVVGLTLVACCACRQAHARSSDSSSSGVPPARGGLKKKAIEMLPTISFVQGGRRESLSECAICLAEFVEGEGLRVLPHCNHAFHMVCVDTWLAACASCPSCRGAAVMVPAERRGRYAAT